jgi:hypothetical protein
MTNARAGCGNVIWQILRCRSRIALAAIRATRAAAALSVLSFLPPRVSDADEANRERDQHPVLQMRMNAKGTKFPYEPVHGPTPEKAI